MKKLLTASLLLVSIFLQGCGGFVSETPLIDRELFFADADISYGQLSPNGEYFSFLKPVEGIKNVWVKKLEDPFEAAYQVTNETERSIRNYFWTWDSQQIIYAQDKGGNENTRIYSVDPTSDSQETQDLTPFENVKTYIFQVPKKNPRKILIGLNDRNPEHHDVYELDLDTKERTLVFENIMGYSDFYFDEAGTLRMVEKVTEQDGTIFFLYENGGLIKVYETDPADRVSFVDFHKDNLHAYITTNKGVDLSQLMLLNTQTGDIEFVEKDPANEVNFGGTLFSQKTGDLIGTFYNGDQLRFYPKAQKVAKIWDSIERQVPNTEIYFRSISLDETKWLFLGTKDTDPGSLYIYDTDTDKVDLVYISRPELPMEHLSPMKPIQYLSRDGETIIRGYLTIPKGKKAKNLPVVVNPHGGPHSRNFWGYDAYTQFLANRGYAVLQINFRGSSGYGKKFQNAGDREFGIGYMQHDISDGVEYLIDEGIADPEKIAIFGGSYGGYATLAGLTFTPDLYAAGISYVGISNLITLLKSVPPYWRPILAAWHRRVGTLENPVDVEDMKKRSPVYYADQIKGALMVVQGANDPRVTQLEADQIVTAVRDQGHPVEYLLAADEGHGFANEDNRMAMAVAVEKFFAQHLGGRAQDDVSDEIQTKLDEITVDIETVKVPESFDQLD